MVIGHIYIVVIFAVLYLTLNVVYVLSGPPVLANGTYLPLLLFYYTYLIILLQKDVHLQYSRLEEESWARWRTHRRRLRRPHWRLLPPFRPLQSARQMRKTENFNSNVSMDGDVELAGKNSMSKSKSRHKEVSSQSEDS